MAGIILIIIGIVVAAYFISTYNRLVKLSVKVKEAYAGIEVALIKRYDVLTQSLDVAKGYVAHEKELMVQLVRARSGMSVSETQQVMANQENAIQRIFAVSEAYPQLASSELYKNLQYQITETNEHLSAAKRLYHANVSLYNQAIAVFPANIIAGMTGKHAEEFLKEENVEAKREVSMK